MSILKGIALVLLAVLIGERGASAQGVVVLAGGGAEGDRGDRASWSYLLYAQLLAGGDVDGDGVVRVAVLGTEAPADPNWLPRYFEWIGETLDLETEAAFYAVPTRAAAERETLVAPVARADVAFLRGGDQGRYYDAWNGTRLERHLRDVAARGGALGGTSAGAMSLAEYAFAPGRDLVSADVLLDAHARGLDDADGGPGLHADFLGAVPGVYVETHATWRGRLGRMAGVLALGVDALGADSLVAVGIEERTGVVLRDDTARVVGHGAVLLLRPTPASVLRREPGRPLVFTHLRLDRLADDWAWQPSTGRVLAPPSADVVPPAPEGAPNTGALTLDGGPGIDHLRFEHVAAYDPFALSTTMLTPHVRDAVGFTGAGDPAARGFRQEALFHALYHRAHATGFLLFHDEGTGRASTLTRTAEAPDVLRAGDAMSTLVVDARPTRRRGMAERFASRNGVPHTAALTPLRLHVLAAGLGYDSRRHVVLDAATASRTARESAWSARLTGAHPATGRVGVEVRLPAPAHLRADVYDVLGRRVARLADGWRPAGRYRLTWPAETAAPGVYLVRLRAAGHAATLRVVRR